MTETVKLPNGFECYENVLDVSDLDDTTAMVTVVTDCQSCKSILTDAGASKSRPLTGRPPTKLYLTCDHDAFSAYQILVRQNIELFEADEKDVLSNAQGRNNPIVLGQVGIRCRHCYFVAPTERTRAATYYPSKLSGLYQAAQNLAVSHLMDGCPHVPADLRGELLRLSDQKSAAGGGKQAWAERTHALGVFEDADGLRFAKTVDAFANEHISLK
mmetsp:Transcript_22123/g.28625  ORF Transcript_22123/g.28625 Transcript_22123/m.28625 type:complete len:215 (-) Transcript_22123:287-931(-)|eukprot:CAMPEP_0198137742 /NCGR_PEP_ID=MMETSP1443-20131203/1205_1 /TAXON_ID=186043 /ORGANISM="Entomoneis sp., Strain CCMP2396" /LENGTH=214 /DNA_ID=CAMNT_0043799269 /DNA_START=120 /DNA_END=764 /DNA_ORIENTATION=-